MTNRFFHRGRHGHKPPVAKAAPGTGCPAERLEPRRLMSFDSGSDLAEDPTVTAITWHDQETYAKKGQWLAQFDGVTGTPAEQISAIQGRVAGTGLDLAVADHLGSDGLVLLQAPGGPDYDALHQLLSAVPGYDFVEPNFVQIDPPGQPSDEPVFPGDPLFNRLWGLHNTGQAVGGEAGVPDADIDAPEAWDITTGGYGFGNGRKVVVAVIDTGVDYNHPDLAANMWRNKEELIGAAGVDDDGNGFVDDVYGYDFIGAGDPDPMDDNNHGTHVSGTIGGVGNNGLGVSGVNWGVEIMALKFLNSSGRGFYSDAIEAFNYVTMMRDRGVNVRVTNNSWSGDAFSAALRNAIAAGGEAGILCVASAGNESRDADLLPRYPAAFDLPNIISVAITTNRDAKGPASNWGAKSVDLGAPGRNILSTIRGGGYALMSGTSMSAPHVAGVAALGWGLRPGASYQEIRDAVFDGVDRIPSMQGATPTVTGGRLNAFNTLWHLLPGHSARVFGLPDLGEDSKDDKLDDAKEGEDSVL